MKILKYKRLSNGKYQLFLDSDKEMSLYEETILKYELLLKGDISVQQEDEINKYNDLCEVYYVGMKSLKSRFKSTKELRDNLLKKGYSIDSIDLAINKLLEQGYLNDDLFSISYINNQIMTTNRGPLKLVRELLNKGVNRDIINKNISIFTNDLQIEKVNKVINKLISNNKTRGGIVLKKKILSDLMNLGYDQSLITHELSKYDISNNSDIYKKEYDKLYKKLSKKYSDKELEYKIKERLYQKGLYYEN